MMLRSIAAVALLCLGNAAAAAERPNFLVVIADDCTFRDLGCYGGQARTPHIDALAAEGMRLTRCFQAAPMCSPTRHNLYTGLYPVRSGAYPNHTFVQPGVQSVPHYLKPLGYRVALSGKTHIAPREQFPFEYSGRQNNPDEVAIDRLLSECARDGTPFCLFACSNEPHSPWNKGDRSVYDADRLQLPPYFADTPQTRQDMVRYLAEVSYFDSQVGRYLQLLDKHGQRDNTLVIVLSEQGSSFPFGKWTCYDTGLQSALIARWPGRVPAGTTNAALVEYVDILPTMIEAAGAPVADRLEGNSLLPVLTGRAQQHKQYVFGLMTTRGIIAGSDYFGIRSARSERFKYIRNFTPDVTFTNACTKSKTFQSWREAAEAGDADAAEKIRRYQHRPAEEFYDVVNDPYEWHNLADDPRYAAELREHRQQLDRWMHDQGDQGQATELDAPRHQTSWLRKQRENTSSTRQ